MTVRQHRSVIGYLALGMALACVACLAPGVLTALQSPATCPGCGKAIGPGHECHPAPLGPKELASRKSKAHKLSQESARSFLLSSENSPKPPSYREFIADPKIAVALGKALFWDVRVGSDDKTACATCHHFAGVDVRTRNLIHVIDETQIDGLPKNYAWKKSDVAEPKDGGLFPKSQHIALGSPGVPLRDFDGLEMRAGLNVENGTKTNPLNINDNAESRDVEMLLRQFGDLRQVTPRNAPSAINAVFSDRLFHDGRAADLFNGHDPFGPEEPLKDSRARDPLGKWRTRGGVTERVPIAIPKAAAASQALGPVLSRLEMSYRGRTWQDVAAKLLDSRPLAQQAVHPEDLVLGSQRHADGPGLVSTYRELIRRAFQPEWWAGAIPADRPERALTGGDPMVANFSLYFGLAVLSYESTLVSDESPWDRFQRGDATALSPRALRGWQLFVSVGCADCHAAPTFGGGTVEELRGSNKEQESPFEEAEEEEAKRGHVPSPPGTEIVEWMRFPGFTPPLYRPYDNGYYNLGVSEFFPNGGNPSSHSWDPGIGGFVQLPADDPGKPPAIVVSETANQIAQRQVGKGRGGKGTPPAAVPPPRTQQFSTARRSFPGQGPNPSDGPSVDGGAFRTPSLRNVSLTAPYMHNGAFGTLRQVLEFYKSGPRFPNPAPAEHPDARKINNLHPALAEVRTALANAPSGALEDLETFLESLTDPRVARSASPFEHPQLFLVTGQSDAGMDVIEELPATGAAGSPPPKAWAESLQDS